MAKVVFSLLLLVGLATAKAPHIIHIVGDDIGWNDVGYVNPDMRTPHVDRLVKSGVELQRFYAYKECAPSRSSMMTGRLAFKYGYYQNPSDDGGVPSNYTMIPEVLSRAGYRTHAIGKWHCGFRTPAMTPTNRGFETFLGFWHWGEEYLDHAFPPYYKDAKCRGVDFVNDTAGRKHSQALMDQNGTLSAAVFMGEFERIVAAHPKDEPLYVYLAFQNAHDPYEHAPADLVSHYDTKRSYEDRRNFSAIVEDLDLALGQAVRTLEEAGLWQDTVLIFNADNGGELPFADQSKCTQECLTTGCCGGAGSNFPLRGGKFTNFEGGMRARAFVAGGSDLIPRSRRGSVWQGLAHVSDWLPTMASLAGAAYNDVPTDGHDLWRSIMGHEPSPRKELVHQPLNVHWNGSCAADAASNPFQASCGAAITVWPYKLLVGFPGDARVVELPAAGHRPETSPSTHRDLCVATPCLFNIEEDPSEAKDLAKEEPKRVEALLERLRRLSEPEALPQPPDAVTPEPSDAACAMVAATGAWLPWDGLDELSLV